MSADVSPLLPPAPGALWQGFALMASLIVAIGAQNALVLRQGLARSHVAAVVAFCTASDCLLTAAGIFGMAALVAHSPGLLQGLRVGGALFLAAYALRAAHSAWRHDAASLSAAGAGGSLAGTLATAGAMTYLNPHVYLDVMLVGLVGARHTGASQWFFAGGAALASAAWFAMLGFGAAWAAPWLRRPWVWRAIDASVAVLMAALAAQLVVQAPGSM